MARRTRTHTPILWLLVVILGLAGCAGQERNAAEERLPTTTRLSDAELELDLRQRLAEENPVFADSRIRIISVDGRVLLLGRVPEPGLTDSATAVARDSERLRLLHNELTAGEPLSARVVASDQWISTRVKGRMIADRSLPTDDIKVATFRGNVYLLGALPADKRQQALELAAEVSGVQRVISLFDQITE